MERFWISQRWAGSSPSTGLRTKIACTRKLKPGLFKNYPCSRMCSSSAKVGNAYPPSGSSSSSAPTAVWTSKAPFSLKSHGSLTPAPPRALACPAAISSDKIKPVPTLCGLPQLARPLTSLLSLMQLPPRRRVSGLPPAAILTYNAPRMSTDARRPS